MTCARRSITHEAVNILRSPKGTSPAAVIKKLAAAGIIKHEQPVLMYLKLTGVGQRFKAGEYDFPSPISPQAVLAKLQTGEQRLIRLTVVEGWTRWDIANAMARLPELKLADPDSALSAHGRRQPD